MVKIGIVEHADFSPLAINNLLSLGTVSCFNIQSESLKEFIGDKDVLLVRLNYFYGEELLSHARNLKIICSPTTSYKSCSPIYQWNQPLLGNSGVLQNL